MMKQFKSGCVEITVGQEKVLIKFEYSDLGEYFNIIKAIRDIYS